MHVTKTQTELMLERQRAASPPAALSSARPSHVNLGNARTLGQPEILEFRERRFTARPITPDEGFELLELVDELEKTGDDRRAHLRVIGRLVITLWDLLRPRWLPCWIWRLRPNAFRHASQEEILDLLGFFARCQTISRVRHRFQTADRNRPPTT